MPTQHPEHIDSVTISVVDNAFVSACRRVWTAEKRRGDSRRFGFVNDATCTRL